ncbi:hypothetical protein P7C70_g9608, partial [Phenoliferia sp. Uapishka_3]
SRSTPLPSNTAPRPSTSSITSDRGPPRSSSPSPSFSSQSISTQRGPTNRSGSNGSIRPTSSHSRTPSHSQSQPRDRSSIVSNGESTRRQGSFGSGLREDSPGPGPTLSSSRSNQREGIAPDSMGHGAGGGGHGLGIQQRGMSTSSNSGGSPSSINAVVSTPTTTATAFNTAFNSSSSSNPPTTTTAPHQQRQNSSTSIEQQQRRQGSSTSIESPPPPSSSSQVVPASRKPSLEPDELLDHDSVLSNVEEMLEGFEWRGLSSLASYGSSHGGQHKSGGKGKADEIEKRLVGELKALEAASIHAIIESDDGVGYVLKHLDDALAELERMDGLIGLFKSQLNVRFVPFSHILLFFVFFDLSLFSVKADLD